MKLTSKDLMKIMGLQVGDRIKVEFEFTDEELFEVSESILKTIYLKSINNSYIEAVISDLVDRDFEILQKPKRVGDLECSGDCENCPLMAVCSWNSDFQGKNLYEVLNYELTTVHDDQEIYDLLKARLDKEVLGDE